MDQNGGTPSAKILQTAGFLTGHDYLDRTWMIWVSPIQVCLNIGHLYTPNPLFVHPVHHVEAILAM